LWEYRKNEVLIFNLGGLTMLLEFSAANYRSILERQVLGLAANGKDDHLQRNVGSAGEDITAIRSAVLYGPNAAGKSNLLRALQTLQLLIVNSAVGMQEGQLLPVNPFLLDKESANQPSEFGIVFIAADSTRYEYFCALTSQRIEKEWLVAYPKGRSQRWFEREFNHEDQSYKWWFGPNFKGERTERKVWQDFTRSNSLFFSTAIQLNNEQLKPAFNWIAQKLIVVPAGSSINPFLSLELLRQPGGAKDFMDFLKAADVGIERVEVREEELQQHQQVPGVPPGMTLQINLPQLSPGSTPQPPKVFKIFTWHKRNGSSEDVAFDLSDESDGTRKLFEFIGGWERALSTGATLFVDELDRSLHPYITHFLVSLFHGKRNEKNAQLIFTTHDTTLLDTNLLRRDQVWFVEKDQKQSTILYPLLDYSPRKDEALERGYMKGRYGAVPLVDKLHG
jgi:uncharacterized protein